MFTGLVESVQPILRTTVRESALTIFVGRPDDYSDIRIGDSISVNGICLTLEEFTARELQFTLGHETLTLLFQDENPLGSADFAQPVNLERSLRFGDRLHGHLVTGHVEGRGVVTESTAEGECWILKIWVPVNLAPGILNKGSITLHGVSLTVNRFEDQTLNVCLIPETIKKTNLSRLRVGDRVNVETDVMVKNFNQWLENEDFLKKVSERVSAYGKNHEHRS